MNYNKDIVVQWFAEHGLIALPEFPFHASRKWRFDFVIGQGGTDQTVALEVEGGVFTGGRHTRGSGFVKDLEKYNEAAALGWRIIRCQPKDLCTTETLDVIKRALSV